MKTEIHFIGLGNAGSMVTGHFYRWGLKGKFSCINDSLPEQHTGMMRFLCCPSVHDKSEIRRSELDNPELLPFRLLTEEIKQLVSGNEMLILLSGLGGYTGTNLTLQLTKYLIKTEKRFYLICSMPFLFEGNIKCNYAGKALSQLKSISTPNVFSLNDILRKYENLTLANAFEMAKDEFLWEYMRIRVIF